MRRPHITAIYALTPAHWVSRGTMAQRSDLTPIHPDLFYYRPHRGKPERHTISVDVCIYGGTVASVAARLTGWSPTTS